MIIKSGEVHADKTVSWRKLMKRYLCRSGLESERRKTSLEKDISSSGSGVEIKLNIKVNTGVVVYI
jgi:hypothetical protein